MISKYVCTWNFLKILTNKYDAESFSAKLQCAAPDSIMGKISFSDSPVLELLILSGLKRTLEHTHSKDKGFICRRCKWMTHFTERAEALLDIGIDNLMAAVHGGIQ